MRIGFRKKGREKRGWVIRHHIKGGAYRFCYKKEEKRSRERKDYGEAKTRFPFLYKNGFHFNQGEISNNFCVIQELVKKYL